MRLGIHARELTGLGGSNTYVTNILSCLAEMDPSFEVVIFYTGDEPDHLRDDNVELIKNPTERPILSDHLILPYLVKRHNVDLVWFPKNVCPMLYQGPSVVSILDLGYFVHSDYYPYIDRTYMKQMISYSCKNANKILAISENTKQDIVKYLDVDADKIVVSHLGVDDVFWNECSEDVKKQFKSTHSIDTPVIYGGNIGKRKNIRALISAFESTQVDAELLLTGKEPGRELKSHIDESSSVRYLGYLSNEEIHALYEIAELFVYPSNYEGFGLPPLEAMACGTPVIASNTSSIPEVVGDAALTVSPSDVEKIANSIERVYADDDLRIELIEKGKERARNFTWEKTTRTTINVLRDVYEDI